MHKAVPERHRLTAGQSQTHWQFSRSDSFSLMVTRKVPQSESCSTSGSDSARPPLLVRHGTRQADGLHHHTIHSTKRISPALASAGAGLKSRDLCQYPRRASQPRRQPDSWKRELHAPATPLPAPQRVSCPLPLTWGAQAHVAAHWDRGACPFRCFGWRAQRRPGHAPPLVATLAVGRVLLPVLLPVRSLAR